MLEIVEMDNLDAELMAERMRDMDRAEFTAMTHGEPHRDSLIKLMRGSRVAKAAYVDGYLVAVYGVIARNALTTEGHPWLAATDRIDRKDVRRLFIKHTRTEFASMIGGFSYLWNLVSDDNDVAIRWLKWIGFEFDGSSYEIGGLRFLKFEAGS